MSTGWGWAYKALRMGRLNQQQVEAYIERSPDAKFKEGAQRGLADYLEEREDEEKIAAEDKKDE